MTDKRNKRPADGEDNFYEAMPGVMNDYYYGDMTGDTEDFERTSEDRQIEHMSRQAKTTAIITITLAVAMAMVLAVLFFKGIDVIKNIGPSTTQSQTP